MKLKQIHIYGYGRLYDFKMDNLSDLQLFFGENEAGKSTIMSFIHSILFGFPTLQQPELRYEPKTRSAYGGKLVLETESFGEVVIERIKGKAAGDVTVLLEDGSVESAEFLSRLLNGTDKTMYRSIFSFDLQGLQEIRRLKEEEIGKYLIAAGTVGTDDLLRLEQQLQRDLHELFKPGGRKPVLNEQLKKIREQEQQLKKAKQENAEYESLLAKIEEIRSRTDEEKMFLQQKKAELDERIEIHNKWPLLEERDQIKKRLFELDPIDFPADGLNRLEKFNDRLLEISSSLKTLNERIKNIEDEIEENALHPALDHHKAKMFIGGWPIQQQSLRELSSLEESIARDRQKIASILAELHYPAEKSGDIPSLNLGIDMKARMKETLQQYIRYEGRLKDLEERLKEEKKTVEELESSCEEIENQFVDENTFKEWKIQYEEQASATDIEEEKQRLQSEIEELEKRLKQEKDIIWKRDRQKSALSTAALLIFGGLLVWSLAFKQWTLALSAVPAMAFAAYSLVRKAEGSGVDFMEENLNAKRKRLRIIEERLKDVAGNMHIAYRYKEQVQLRDRWKAHFARLEEQKRRLEESVNLYQGIRESAGAEERKLNIIKSELGLEEDFSHLKIEDAYSMLKNLQQLDSQVKEKMATKEGIQKDHEAWVQSLFKYLDELGKVIHEPAQAVYFLQETLKKEQEKRITLKELKKKLSDLNMEVLQLHNEKLEIHSNLENLFKVANVGDEEAFRKNGLLVKEKNVLKERLALLDKQLGDEKKDDFQNQDELQSEINYLKELIETRSKLLEEDRDSLATLKQEVRFLEEGGTYTENLHLFRQRRSSFNEEARNWAVLAAAKSLLEKVMGKYKEGRFPKVIQKAAEYFSFLTDGEYIKIHFQTDGSLAVERKDRVLFAPGELSRGTGEQLYISIRLGLVHVLKEECPFPVIIDDGFVNFDQKRTRRMLELIQQISTETQVLLFTCHRHIAGQFSEERVIELKERQPLTIYSP